MNGMNIKAKIALTIGVLVSMIVLLVALSVANLQILTATEPDSPGCRSGIEPGLDMDYGNRRHLHLDRYRYAHQVACIH